MDHPGLEVQSLPTIGKDTTNQVFFDDVFVPDDYLVGQRGKGFQMISEALDLERFTMFTLSPITHRTEVLVDWVKQAKRDDKPLKDDTNVRRTIAHIVADTAVAKALSVRFVCAAKSGGKPPTIESSQYKLFTTSLSQRVCKDALDIPGTRRRDHGRPGRRAAAWSIRRRLPRDHERDGGRRILGDPEEHHRAPSPRVAEELLSGELSSPAAHTSPDTSQDAVPPETIRIKEHPRMDLDLTDEQQMIIDMTRQLMEEHCTVETVRLLEDDPKGYPDELWKQMSELGLNGLLIPESHGGGGQTVFEGALVYEELGRAMAPDAAFRLVRDERRRAARSRKRRAEGSLARTDRERRKPS